MSALAWALLSAAGAIAFACSAVWLLERQQRKKWAWLSKDPIVALQQIRGLARLERELQRRLGRFRRGDFRDLHKPYPKVRGAGEP